jgi:hypothetical protein
MIINTLRPVTRFINPSIAVGFLLPTDVSKGDTEKLNVSFCFRHTADTEQITMGGRKRLSTASVNHVDYLTPANLLI